MAPLINVRLTCVKVGDISRSPREPFEYCGEPFSNLISLDNQYLGKTIYFPETENIIWRMVLFYFNICESESESVPGRITATTATTMGVSDMCNKTSVTDAYDRPTIPSSRPTNTKI